jgi:hypothetical protein
LALNQLLIHTVEVYRRSGATDRFGQPKSVNPRQHQVGGETLVHTYPCRTYMKSGGLLMNERMIDTFEKVNILYTDVGVDIREDDAVRVVDANGYETVGLCKIKDSEIKYDSRGPHHCEFTLWIQDGPDRFIGTST